MTTDVMDPRAWALAAAAAWWQGRPFPLTAAGGPYPCTTCGRPITTREGTSLIGPWMRCAECTTSWFGAAAPVVPTARTAPLIEAMGARGPAGEAWQPYAPGPMLEPSVAAPPYYAAPPTAPAAPPFPPPSGRARQGRRWSRRTWLVVSAIAAVIALVPGGLLLGRPGSRANRPPAPRRSTSCRPHRTR